MPETSYRIPITPLLWGIGTVLIGAGGGLTYALEVQNWHLAQAVSIVGVALILGGLTLLVKALSLSVDSDSLDSDQTSATEKKRGPGETKKAGEVRDILLRRLVMVAGFGLGIIFLYSVQGRNWPAGHVLSTLGIGFVSAGAAWLSGALLGFLFGIPHTREGQTETPKLDTGTDGQKSRSANLYAPSTSLEQISDWLTKIIVGVGLTQLNNIPHKLDQLAQYIAQSWDGDKLNPGFALGIILYFSVCGFLFGYLWGRLYMLGLFREADLEKRLENIEEKLTIRDLVERQLDPKFQPPDPAKLHDAVRTASEGSRKEVLDLVISARESEDVTDETMRRAIPILRALIEADKDNLEHRLHSELGYILRELGQPKEAVNEFARAIDIRDLRGKSGWRSYEYQRARGRIRLDTTAAPLSPEEKKQVVADLRAVWRDPKVQERVQKPEIKDWLAKNNMTIESHISNP